MLHRIPCASGEVELGFADGQWWFAHYIGRDTSPSWSGFCDSVVELIATTSGEIEWSRVDPAIIAELRSHHDRAYLKALELVARGP